MTSNQESGLRTTISHAALSAGIAFSFTAIADDASAQQTQPQGPGGNVVLDTVDVEAQQQADGEGAYAVQSASSPKQTAPLLDTPQTVTVIPHAIIQERGARNLTEVLRNTPGITFDAGENGFSTSPNNFKLRGFDTSGSVFIDGSRDNGSYTRDTFNTERVEVFKGAAADNGRGTAGGYINMVTKSPILQNFIAGEVGFGFDEYGSKVRKRTTTDVNYMATPTTAVRINGMWEDGGVPGREVAENNAWGFAPTVAFGLGTDKRAIFAYEHVTRRDLPDWGVPGQIIPGTHKYTPGYSSVSRDNFYGLKSDFDDADSDVALARFEYDFSKNVTISNQTRWSSVDREARFTLPNSPNGPFPPGTTTVDTQTQFYGRDNTTLTNLTNLSAEFFTGAFKHNMSAGVELSREEATGDRFTAQDADSTSLFNPDPNRRSGWPYVRDGWSKVKVDTIAAYLYDTIDLNPQWQITGGLRAEHYKVHIDSSDTPNFLDASETTLGGKVGIVYKPTADSSIYASVGLSHQPPGSYLSNSDISRGSDEQTFPGFVPGADPVRSINYEFGVKRDFFGGRLQTTAAIFRTEQRVPVAPGNVLFGYGKQIVQGVELGVAGNITDKWKVFGGALFLDSERKLSAAQDLALCNASPSDYGGAPLCGIVRANGDELAFTPNFSANLWTTYRFDNRWTLGGGLQYVGESWVGRPDNANRVVKNGVNGKLPDYFLVHLMASYEIRKDVNIVFNVDNVFDKTYAQSLNWSARKAQLGAPRTYRISGNFRF